MTDRDIRLLLMRWELVAPKVRDKPSKLTSGASQLLLAPQGWGHSKEAAGYPTRTYPV